MRRRTTVTTANSVERLFARYRSHGDVDAIAEVYDRTAVRLLSVASHLCTEPADAEDAVQATFVAALESADEWQPDRPLEPWLVGILTHRVLRLRRSRPRVDRDRLREAIPTGPHDAAEAAEFSVAVDEAIAGLPQLYQSVLVLRLKHGMAPADIAHALRRPPATVRAQLSRGLEMLRKSLPPIFAAGLLVGSLPARGTATIKTAVLDAAARFAPRPAPWQGWAETLARPPQAWLGVTAAAVLSAILAFALWPRTASASPGERTGEAPPPGPARAAEARLEDVPDAALAARPAQQLRRVPASQDAGPELTVVVQHGGGPAPGARVELEFLGDEPEASVTSIRDRWGERLKIAPAHASGVARRLRVTDVEGRATFVGLELGYWVLHTPGRSGVVQITEKAPARVAALDAGSTARFVRGRVTDPDQAPLAGASIWATSGPDDGFAEPLTTTDADGRFAVLAVAGARLLCRAPGRRPKGLRVTETTGDEPLVLRLRRGGGAVRGTVRDASGQPVVGARVRIGRRFDAVGVDEGIAVPTQISTDEDGRFALDGLARGTVHIEVRAPGYAAWGGRREVATDRATSTSIELKRGATIRGTVYGPTGAPVSGARVRILEPGTSATFSSADGSFALHGVAPGSIATVLAGSQTHGWGLGEVQARADAKDPVSWNAHLAWPRLTIEGRVEGAIDDGWRVAADFGGTRTVSAVAPSGLFAVEVPEFQAGRLATLTLHRANELDGTRPVRIARDAVVGTRIGDRDLVLDVNRRAGETGGLRGTWRAADRSGPPDRIWVGRDVAEDRALVPVVRRPDHPEGFVVGELPPGDYWLQIHGRRIGPFAVLAGHTTDVGRIEAHDAPTDPPRHTLAFVPAEPLPFAGRLEVLVHDRNGRIAVRSTLDHHHGAWRMPLWLDDGDYTATAIVRGAPQTPIPFVVHGKANAYAQVLPLTR